MLKDFILKLARGVRACAWICPEWNVVESGFMQTKSDWVWNWKSCKSIGRKSSRDFHVRSADFALLYVWPRVHVKAIMWKKFEIVISSRIWLVLVNNMVCLPDLILINCYLICKAIILITQHCSLNFSSIFWKFFPLVVINFHLDLALLSSFFYNYHFINELS